MEEESRYLAVASPILGDVAAFLADTGLRPDECHRLRWEEITWTNGRNGTLLVSHGKTAASRRVLPMTPRVRSIFEKRWLASGRPSAGWIWPAPTKAGHINHSSLKKQHAKALKLSGVRPFVLYSLRHTFLTRLGESGCDAWTLARVAGHSSVAISSRYVHPSEDAVLARHFSAGWAQFWAQCRKCDSRGNNRGCRKYSRDRKLYGERGRTRTCDPCLKRVANPITNNNLHVQLTPFRTL